ncbi:MAG: XdhC family protein [Rhodospirillales bacterium]|nr:XdhC family protein [Rhodospirillales bacterium]
MADPENILGQGLAWLDQGHALALATVTSTWGSSPRPVGSQLIINDRGDFAGSVSGGCIETFVVSEALDVIADGGVLNLEYGVSDEQAREVRLACGGTVRVFVEPGPKRAVLEKLQNAQPVARVVDTQSGLSCVLELDRIEGDLVLEDMDLSDARLLLKHGSSSFVDKLFVQVYTRPRNLVIVGAVHIAQVLAPMAAAIGFSVSVIDPRPKFATPERLPGVTIIKERPETATDAITFDNWTAVLALAHDPQLDDPVLQAALNSDAYYIGCLGSRKTHGSRLARLRALGFDDQHLKRLHGPVGLDIGGRSPGEIAVSILAEIIAVGNGKK